MSTTPQTNTTLREIADLLRTCSSAIICGHVNPDGDCIGSTLALAHALKSHGASVTCLLAGEDPVEATLRFLPGAETFVPVPGFSGSAQVFIGVDVPSRARMGEAASAVRDRCAQSVTIDHHASDTTMCDHVYVDPDAASCSLLVWEVAKLLGCSGEALRKSALCAFTGLVTDTGGFCFQNTGEAAFATAADMCAHGADPALVARNVFQNRSRASLILEARALERMEVFAGGRGVVSFITAEDMVQAGAVKADTEPLVNALRSMEGVEIACMLREQEGLVRGSLRAKDALDVAAIARSFGGGGHVAAAGFTYEGGLKGALSEVRNAIEAALEKA